MAGPEDGATSTLPQLWSLERRLVASESATNLGSQGRQQLRKVKDLPQTSHRGALVQLDRTGAPVPGPSSLHSSGRQCGPAGCDTLPLPRSGQAADPTHSAGSPREESVSVLLPHITKMSSFQQNVVRSTNRWDARATQKKMGNGYDPGLPRTPFMLTERRAPV